MNIRTQILVLLVCLLGLTLLVKMVQKGSMKLKYTIPWFFLTAAIFIFAAFPELSHQLALLLGVGAPVNLLFFAGFCFLLAMVLAMTAALSMLSGKVKILIQNQGMLEQELADQEEIIRRLRELVGEDRSDKGGDL